MSERAWACTRCALPVAGTEWVADLAAGGDEPGAVHLGCLTLAEQFEVSENLCRRIDELCARRRRV